MKLHSRYSNLLLASIALIVLACTNYQEEEAPVALSVDTSSLAFSSGVSTRSTKGETRSLTVTSGSKWDVTSMPEWINLESIYQSGVSPYQWTVSFSANINNEYNREGKIVISSMTDRVEILASQEGPKGEYVAVESISLSSSGLTITEGESTLLTYEITPSNASLKDVSWKSSNASVATVSRSGQIDAISEGTTLITVTTVDGNKTASCTVTVKAKVISVTGVSLDKTSLTMTEGDTQTLTATVSPSNATDKSVTWSSSAPTVAEVSSSGVVIAKSAGNATITVKTTDGNKTATCAVTVKAKVISVTGISLDKTTLTMTEGDTQTLTATVTPSNATDKSVTWTCSAPSVAEVSSSGVVIAKSAGSSTITVKTTDGSKTATCAVTVKAKVISVTGVSLDKTNLTMSEGDTKTLTATVTPSNATDKSVTWTSSAPSVAEVSSSGVVIAKSAGSATITVTTNDGSKKATCSVTVIVPVISVSLNITSLSMGIGDTQILTATVTPSNATDKTVTWSSSNTSVATVSSSGIVTAKMVGSAIITATTNDGGKTAMCSITVVYPTPEAIDLGLSVKWASFNLGAAKPEEYGYYYAWGEKDTKEKYYWNTYLWCMGNGLTLNKYCTNSSYGIQGFKDDKTVLELQDDAGYVFLGKNWRLPSSYEIDELIKKCTWEITSVNGVLGWKATGSNGNSVFFPLAGHMVDTDLLSNNSFGYYWSSSLRTDLPYAALCLYFSSDTVARDYSSRMTGLSIRPVLE